MPTNTSQNPALAERVRPRSCVGHARIACGAHALRDAGYEQQLVRYDAARQAPAVDAALLAGDINSEHALAQQSAENAVQHAVRCGQLLLEVKDSLKHGELQPWIEVNCRFAYSTAARYMKAAKQISTGVEISNLRGLFDSGKPHVLHNSGENEWYTPPDIIERARRAMGAIDCDPASCALANKTVTAEMFYTAADNGLSKKWRGRVWLNPPYSNPLCSQFCEATMAKFLEGEINQACVLVNNATETAWFQKTLRAAAAVCFLKGRVNYLDKTGEPANTPLQGQAVLYFGKRIADFQAHFSDIGIILVQPGYERGSP